MKLQGKTVFVTGSSRGIGKAIAFEFAKQGCTVILNASKSQEELEQTFQELKAFNCRCYSFLGDVSNYSSCVSLFQQIEMLCGPVDILINNAGICHFSLFTQMKPEEWENLLAVNFHSVLNCTHLALPSMIRKKDGIILNISSMWGEKGASCEAVYSATKGAINAFTKAIAKEVGPSHIRVNAISCGVIDTSMNAWLTKEEKESLTEDISLMRFGKPEEVAKLAAFLSGENSEFISGQIITIDGCMV